MISHRDPAEVPGPIQEEGSYPTRLMVFAHDIHPAGLFISPQDRQASARNQSADCFVLCARAAPYSDRPVLDTCTWSDRLLGARWRWAGCQRQCGDGCTHLRSGGREKRARRQKVEAESDQKADCQEPIQERARRSIFPCRRCPQGPLATRTENCLIPVLRCAICAYFHRSPTFPDLVR
jgi:hypothetical protein